MLKVAMSAFKDSASLTMVAAMLVMQYSVRAFCLCAERLTKGIRGRRLGQQAVLVFGGKMEVGEGGLQEGGLWGSAFARLG